MNNIERLIYELRNSADIVHNIFTRGSCFRLFLVLREVFPTAIPYWSDVDNHCVVNIEGEYYDIGGKLSKYYVESKGYFRIPEDQYPGYSILKYTPDEKAEISVKPEKYAKI